MAHANGLHHGLKFFAGYVFAKWRANTGTETGNRTHTARRNGCATRRSGGRRSERAARSAMPG